MKRFHFQAVFFSLTSFVVIGCGGGGGSSSGGAEGDFVGAANVSVRTTPAKIDSGDRTLVAIDISDVHESGIAVKIRFPVGLDYVKSSAFLNVGGKKLDISPTINETDQKEDVTYLVFYLSQAQFKRSGQEYSGEQGALTLQLEGRDSIKEGQIEVDPDVDDPAEDNNMEFKLDNPEFVAEDTAAIEVVAE